MTADETPARSVRKLRDGGFIPKKSRGQNFLTDPNILRKIVGAAALTGGERVVEIGAGTGALTGLLAAQARSLVAVEVDRELQALLAEKFTGTPSVEIVNADILQTDLAGLCGPGRAVVMGNVPYAITSQIVIATLRASARISRALLLMQREVAERIIASPGSREFSRISLAVQYVGHAEKLFTVGAAAFSPRPRVESALLRIDFDHPPACRAADDDLLFSMAEALFRERRKMIRSGLRSFGAFTAPTIEAIEAAAGVPLTARPEDLTLEQWCALSDAVGEFHAE